MSARTMVKCCSIFLTGEERRKARFGGELLIAEAPADLAGKTFLDYFQQEVRRGRLYVWHTKIWTDARRCSTGSGSDLLLVVAAQQVGVPLI